MSLKAFHILFLLVAGSSSLLTGMWAIREWQATGEGTILMLAVVSLVVLVALVPYGIWFMKKFKNVGYL
jgi:ABC-type transport system involved in multi-copper enzyme maturation permease subunit